MVSNWYLRHSQQECCNLHTEVVQTQNNIRSWPGLHQLHINLTQRCTMVLSSYCGDGSKLMPRCHTQGWSSKPQLELRYQGDGEIKLLLCMKQGTKIFFCVALMDLDSYFSFSLNVLIYFSLDISRLQFARLPERRCWDSCGTSLRLLLENEGAKKILAFQL